MNPASLGETYHYRMQKRGYFIVSLFISSIFWLGCESDGPPEKDFQGSWRSVGYGKMLHIDSLTVHWYDHTKISCLPASTENLSGIIGRMNLRDDTLVLEEGFDRYYFIRVPELPEPCQTELTAAQQMSPVYNFEVFAQTISENFAYFERNKLNWEGLYTHFADKVNESVTQPELYLFLRAMLDSLQDNHGYLEAPGIVEEIAAEISAPLESETSGRTYGDFEVAAIVANQYLENDMSGDSRVVRWGTLAGQIGYIQVNAMMLHANLELSDSLIREQGYVQTYFEAMEAFSPGEQWALEVAGISKTMQEAISDLKNTRLLLLDLRFNGGGNDDVGLEILRWFNQEKRQVAWKKAVAGDSFSPKVPIFLESCDAPYLGTVVLLTSKQSASATDFTAMASMELLGVYRIGAPTEGALSDALNKTLPNGWYFSLSNEIYTDMQGNCYESVGIPVHIDLGYPSDRQTFFRQLATAADQDLKMVLQALESL